MWCWRKLEQICPLDIREQVRGLNVSLGFGVSWAAPIQNIGAYGSEVCDVIESVYVYDVKRNLISISNKDCAFGYRTSV